MSTRKIAICAGALLALGVAGEAAAQRAPEARSRAVVELTRRGWIGITYSTSGTSGRMAVTDVTPGSPAAGAGLTVGDTIVRWDGDANPEQAAFRTPVQPGDTLRLRVRRDGRTRDVTVVAVSSRSRPAVATGRGGGRDVYILRPSRAPDEVWIHMDSIAVHADSMHVRLRAMLRDSLGPALQRLEETGLRRFETVEMPRLEAELQAAQARLAEGFSAGARAVAGAEFAEVNAGLASYFGTERGALVLRVAPETPAARAGLQAGDVVISANGHPVSEVRDLREAVVRSRARDVELQIVRRGSRTALRLRWE